MQNRFVIVGTQRSGTTLIRQCLDSHPQVMCRDDLFADSYGRKDGYRYYRFANPWRQIAHYLQREAQVKRFLRDRLQAPHGVSATGFRLMQSHVRSESDGFPMLLPYLRQEGFRVLHIVRANVVRVALSREALRVSGRSRVRDKGAPITLSLPTKNLVRVLGALEEENAFWVRAARGMKYLQVEYEDFSAEQEVETARMLEFLDVAPTVALSAPQKRVNRSTLADTITNFDDVRRALTGTRFEALLEE